MKRFFCRSFFDGEKWQNDVEIVVSDAGLIETIKPGSRNASVEVIDGCMIPGLVNAHSHSFQYAMAGLSEFASNDSSRNDFWSWRKAMYHLAQSVSVQDFQKIAAALFLEMLRNGYTEVVEFHYLQHDQDGAAYPKSIDHIEALCLAALETGIRLTIVPVYYNRGGFNKNPQAEQQRFIFENVETYRKFLEKAAAAIGRAQAGFSSNEKDARIRLGWGIHSLRAASELDIVSLYANRPNSGPAHIHIAEQKAEIEDCLAVYGARPVEWLLDKADIGESDFLVHATHLSESECQKLAASKATVVLCPTTEGNLGDGFFPIETYAECGGNWTIGSDSHATVNPWEELRWLDYQARLRTESRNPLAHLAKDKHSGRYLFQEAFRQGRMASKNPWLKLQVGSPLDAIAIDLPAFSWLPQEAYLDYLVFHQFQTRHCDVFVQGRRVLSEGLHPHEDAILAGFQERMRAIWQKTH